MQGSRRTLVFFTVGIASAALAVLPASALAGSLTPASPASGAADDTRTAYVVMVVLATLLALGIVVGLLAAVRGRSDGERRTRGTTGIQGRVGLGLSVLATAVFIFGIVVTESAREVEPTGANGLISVDAESDGETTAPLQIDVSGQQWLWRYEYPDGTFSYYEMVVPVNTSIALNIDSTDVLHNWWVPALGGMAGVAPGSDNTATFTANETGVFEGRSTEFSGPGYATMRARVRVVDPAEYEAWLTQQAEDITAAQDAVRDRVLETAEVATAEAEASAE